MPVYSHLDRSLLEDERIRRIIKTNENLIRQTESKAGIQMQSDLRHYLENKLTVWEQEKSGHYLSVNKLIKYLRICGYNLDYYIEPIEDNIK